MEMKSSQDSNQLPEYITDMLKGIVETDKLTGPEAAARSNLKNTRLKCEKVVRDIICDVCGKKCKSNAFLRYHQRTHTGERPYNCHLCPKSFALTCLLKIHVRTHTGERPFQCPVCPKAFISKAAISRHERVHTGEKPYECPLCFKCFSQSNALKLHVRTVHLREPWPYKSKARQLKAQQRLAKSQMLTFANSNKDLSESDEVSGTFYDCNDISENNAVQDNQDGNNALPENPVRSNELQYNRVKNNALQDSAIRNSSRQDNTVQSSSLQDNRVINSSFLGDWYTTSSGGISCEIDTLRILKENCCKIGKRERIKVIHVDIEGSEAKQYPKVNVNKFNRSKNYDENLYKINFKHKTKLNEKYRRSVIKNINKTKKITSVIVEPTELNLISYDTADSNNTAQVVNCRNAGSADARNNTFQVGIDVNSSTQIEIDNNNSDQAGIDQNYSVQAGTDLNFSDQDKIEENNADQINDNSSQVKVETINAVQDVYPYSPTRYITFDGMKDESETIALENEEMLETEIVFWDQCDENIIVDNFLI